MSQPFKWVVEINAPGATKDDIGKAAALLARMIDELTPHGDAAFRGYIQAANMGGFRPKPGFATGGQLRELMVRAYWWTFEQIWEAKRKPLTPPLPKPEPDFWRNR